MATELPEKPESREESYLADIAGQEVELPEKPLSRKEQYLAYIAENGGGGGGGTSNFNQLTNRPKYNGTDMTGSTNIPEVVTYSNFTGTDGTAAGAAGLVPAPATTDAGKFLGASGLWEAVQAGGVTELTSADYNYPTNNPSSVGLWKLDTGMYHAAAGVKTRYATGWSLSSIVENTFAVEKSDASTRITFVDSTESPIIAKTVLVNNQNGTVIASNNFSGKLSLTTYNALNAVNSDTYISTPLSSYQGRVLNDKITGLAISGAGAPTTATVGTVGKLYEDTTNGKLYICTDTTGGSYTWEEVGAGGGGITELTAADYNWPTNNPDGVAAWNLTDGYYNSASTVKIYASSTRALSTSASKRLLISSTSSTKSIYSLSGNGYIEATVTFTDNASESGHYEYKNPTIVQTTGTSTTDVMSQNAVTSMVYADPSTMQQTKIGVTSHNPGSYGIEIGYNSDAGGTNSCSIGHDSKANGSGSVALGNNSNGNGRDSVAIGPASGDGSTTYTVSVGSVAKAKANGAIAIGYFSTATQVGEMNIGCGQTTYGYNNSNYRLLSGVYDGQSAHDAATVAQGNTLSTTAPTTSTVGVLGQLYTDTTNMHTYQCTAISGDTYTWTQRW